VALYPLLQMQAHGKAALAAIDWVILILALRAARSSGSESRLGYVLLVPAIVLNALVAFWPNHLAILLSLFAQCAFHTFVIVCLLRYILSDDNMTLDELYAAASLYVLMAFAFSFLLAAIEQLAPGSFYINPANNPDGVVGWWDLVYFSFTCLTSVGFGEITPVSDYARSVVMIEQMSGVLFLAIVISRLISMHNGRSRGGA
jgi:hypothetical protein